MLLDNVDHLTRDLTLALRRLSTSSSTGPVSSDGLYTLLRIVLRLKNVGDSPGLKDTLGALLLQLDFSYFLKNSSVVSANKKCDTFVIHQIINRPPPSWRAPCPNGRTS